MMISKKYAFWALNPLLLTMMAPAAAQQTGDETFVVPANRGNHTVAEMTQITQVIENAELEQQIQGSKKLKDALAQLIPGLGVSGRGRTNYGTNVCGCPLIVPANGARLNPSCTDDRQLGPIGPFNTNYIGVISDATSLYGDGSIGGLINIVTRKGQLKTMMEFEASTKSGFNNSKDHNKRITGAVSGGNEHISGRPSVAYQKFGGWFDGNGDAALLDNTQTGLQYSDRLDIMGAGTLNIDKSWQLRLITQYYKSQGDDDYGLNLGKGFSAIRGTSAPFISNGLNSDRIPGTERHLISLQYSDGAFLGRELVGQVYCRDESLRFYPFPTINANRRMTVFSSSQQDTGQYGMKLTLSNEPMSGWQVTWELDADYERFTSSQMFFDLAQASTSGRLNNKEIYATGRYPSYDIANLTAFLQLGYDINSLSTLNGGVRYQYTENKIDDFIGYAQQRQIAAGETTPVDAIPGGSVDYDNFLFNAGLLMYVTKRQQVWLNFSQGVESPDSGKYYGRDIYDAAMDDHLPLTKGVSVSDSKLGGVKADSYELD